MSLRLRLFLLIAGLVCLLLVGQALLVRSLAGRIDRDVTAVAMRFGEEILSGFELRAGDGAAAPGSEMAWRQRDGMAQKEGAGSGEKGPRAVTLTEESHVVREQTPDGPRVTAEMVIERRAASDPPAPGGGPPPLALVPEGRHEVIFLRGPLENRRIAIPQAPVSTTLGRFGSQLLFGSLGILGLGLIAAAVVAHRATRPLGALSEAARRVGGGELGIEVPVAGAGRLDEIGEAVAAFNTMSRRLAALDRENRRLAESEHLSELGEVARGLAHSLRNPLHALGLTLDRLVDAPDAEAIPDLAERCRLQIRRMDGALRSFLAIASAPEARAEPVELGALAREVALEALQDAAGRVRIDVVAPRPVEVAAVTAEVKAVLQALVVNACEASPDLGRVTIEVGADEGQARIEIADEGPGLAPGIAERLFSPHVTSKPQGSGMGLYLAQRIAATRYGGGVVLAPRSPRGTLATLTLGPRTEGAA